MPVTVGFIEGKIPSNFCMCNLFLKLPDNLLELNNLESQAYVARATDNKEACGILLHTLGPVNRKLAWEPRRSSRVQGLKFWNS